MTDSNPANAYLRTRVMSASPEELRLLLLDGALRFAGQAREGLARKDYEASYSGFTQCRAIILELINTIRPEHAPEIAERAKAIYTFIYTELIESSLEKDIPRLEKAIELIEFERETWVMLMEQVAAERRSGAGAPPATPTAPAPTQPLAPQATPRSFSVQA